MAIGILLALVAAEVGARVLEPGFGHNGDWPSNETFVKYQQLDQLTQPADTVYLGSSLVAFGIDSRYASEESGALHYNAALSAAQVETLDIWTREFVVPESHPRRVVLAFGPNELSASQAGQANFERFVEAPAIQQLRSSTTMRSVEESIQRWSVLFSNRRKLRDVRDIGRAVIDGTFPAYWGEYGERQDDFSGERVDANLLPSGETPQPDSDRVAQLRRLVEWLDDEGIQVVLVAIPTVNALGDAASGGGEELVAALSEIAESSNTTFIDARRLATTEDLFIDGSHLNPTGQSVFTAALLAELEEAG